MKLAISGTFLSFQRLQAAKVERIFLSIVRELKHFLTLAASLL